MAETNPILKAAGIAPGKKYAMDSTAPAPQTKPQLRWVDPVWMSPNELAKDKEAAKRAASTSPLSMFLASGGLQSQFGLEYRGLWDENAAARKEARQNAKSIAVFDTKAMGIPDGFTVGYADSFPGKAYDKNKLRLTKNIGERKWVNYDMIRQADGSVKLSKPWVSSSTSFAQDVAKTLSIGAMLVPGLNAAVGSTLGLTGTAGSVAGGALLHGGIAAIGSEGDLGAIARGAATGGLGGSVQGIASGLAGTGLDKTLSTIAAKGLVGAGTAAINKGNPLVGAILGNIPGVNTGMGGIDAAANWLVKNIIKQQLVPKKV